MTVLTGQDPALPEVSEDEAWYDAEIAPALAGLANRCHERGMSFLALVEYQPGDRGRTVYLTKEVGLHMEMVSLCAATVPNVDRYIMAVKRLCKDKGLDTGASYAMKAFGG